MKSRLSLLSNSDALILLRHSFAIPKILNILRTDPCLAVYDAELRSTLSDVLIIDFSCESAWSQATLPVCFGGIGICKASQLAPSAFLASAAGSYDLINQILPVLFSGVPLCSCWCRCYSVENGSQLSTSCLSFIFQIKGMGPPSCARDIWSAPTGCLWLQVSCQVTGSSH